MVGGLSEAEQGGGGTLGQTKSFKSRDLGLRNQNKTGLEDQIKSPEVEAGPC